MLWGCRTEWEIDYRVAVSFMRFLILANMTGILCRVAFVSGQACIWRQSWQIGTLMYTSQACAGAWSRVWSRIWGPAWGNVRIGNDACRLHQYNRCKSQVLLLLHSCIANECIQPDTQQAATHVCDRKEQTVDPGCCQGQRVLLRCLGCFFVFAERTKELKICCCILTAMIQYAFLVCP